MSPTLGVIIMMNNYFHDVATALLFASGAAMAIMMKKYGSSCEPAVTRYFLAIYESMARLTHIAVIWIILGGIPRTIYYTRFEWANAAGKGQVPALIVKHILMFILVGGGAYLWVKLNRQVKEIRANSSAADMKPIKEIK